MTNYLNKQLLAQLFRIQVCGVKSICIVSGTTQTMLVKDNCVFGGFLTVEEGEAVPRVVRCCIEQVNARGKVAQFVNCKNEG